MAEVQVDVEGESTGRILVCLGERRREVAYIPNKDPKKERCSLVAAIRTTFRDVGFETVGEVVLQMKSEDWGGEFVDLGVEDRVVHKSVINIVWEVSFFALHCYQ
jgi:predicted membrane GTPase involved in stress response